MRSVNAVPVPSLLLAVALLISAGAARAQTIINGSGTISADVTDGVEASGSPGDTLVINPNVTVTAAQVDVPAVMLLTNGYEVTNHGTVSHASGEGIRFSAGVDGVSGTLTNSSSGTIDGGVAVYFSDPSGVDGELVNNGDIVGGLTGVQITGATNVINRDGGDIEARVGVDFTAGSSVDERNYLANQANATIVGTESAAVRFNSVNARLTNGGEIRGAGAVGAVQFNSSGEKYFQNAGGATIEAVPITVIVEEEEVVVHGPAVAFAASPDATGTVQFSNDGTITSGEASAVDIGGEAEVRVFNSGTITSESTDQPVLHIRSAAGDVRVDGKDRVRFTNQGTITIAPGSTAPAVLMGDGDDTVQLLEGTSINGDIDGAAGTDDWVDLQGHGSFAHDLLNFERLTVLADEEGWELSGASEVGTGDVDAGLLRIASGGELTVTDDLRVNVQSGLENAGTIVTGEGVKFGSSDDVFRNSGVVAIPSGGGTALFSCGVDVALCMGAGDDNVILDGGSVQGDIDGGADDDTLTLRGSGSLDPAIGVRSVEHLSMEAGDWTVSSDFAGFEDITVSGGTLSLATGGSLGSSGPASVEAGGILATGVDASDAMLLADLANRGRVQLSGTSAVLTVGGGYSQEASGDLVVEIGDAGAAKLMVTGTATLAGDLVVEPVGFTGDPVNHVILEAGSLDAAEAFDAVKVSPVLEALVCYGIEVCPDPSDSGVPPAPSPGTNKISLQLLESGSFENAATTPNQKAVGGAVDAIRAAGVADPALEALLGLIEQEAFDAGLDQLSPEPLGASAQLAFENARWYTSLLSDHLREMRLGVRVAGQGAASGVQLASLGSGAGSVFRFAPALPAQAPAAAATPGSRKLGLWQPRASGYAVLSDLGSGSSNTGYEAVTGVLGLGTEQWTRRNLLLGVELSAAYTRLESDRDGTDFDAISGRLAVYGSYDRSPWYLDVVTSYAYHWYDATRRIRYGTVEPVDLTADSEHGAHEVSSYVGTGLYFDYAGWDFGPEASVQYTALIEEGYDEKSASEVALDVAKRSEDSLSSRVGVRLSRPWQIDEQNRIEPSLSVAWAHEWLDSSQDMEATFQVSPVGRFEVSSRDLSRDAVVARLGVRAAISETLLVDVGYGVDAGRSGYLSQQLGVAFSGRF